MRRSFAIVGTCFVGALAACFAFVPLRARADLWGADMPVLTAIAGFVGQTYGVVEKQLSNAKKMYEETKRIASYAQDAKDSYDGFKSIVRGDVNAMLMLEELYPDVAYFRREASRTGPWAEATGELQEKVRICFLDLAKAGQGTATPRCVELERAIKLEEFRSSIDQTFGYALPVKGFTEINAVDHEAARGRQVGQHGQMKGAAASERAASLRAGCESEDADATSCQASANQAGIEQLEQAGEINAQLGALNDLTAAQLLQENAKRKREIEEAVERRKVAREIAKKAAEKPPRIKTDGFDF